MIKKIFQKNDSRLMRQEKSQLHVSGQMWGKVTIGQNFLFHYITKNNTCFKK